MPSYAMGSLLCFVIVESLYNSKSTICLILELAFRDGVEIGDI